MSVPAYSTKWVLDHHVFQEHHAFHVNLPFEDWLLNKCNNLHAETFHILPYEHNSDVKVVLFKVPGETPEPKELK